MDLLVPCTLLCSLLLMGTVESSEDQTQLSDFYAYQQVLLLSKLNQKIGNFSNNSPNSCECPLYPGEGGGGGTDSSVFLKGLTEEYALSSCHDLHYEPSRYYYITTETSPPRYMYCETDRLFNVIYYGNWLRVAKLDMRVQTEICPSNFETVALVNDNTKRFCTRKGLGCTSHFFPVHGYQYRTICGKVIAIQKGKPDAFYPSHSKQKTIDDAYVDGVSITCSVPRQHIWTFAAAMHEVKALGLHLCPCTNSENQRNGNIHIPEFVQENYFCDTGSRAAAMTGEVYQENPLWDGLGCGARHDCCARQNDQEYFCASLDAVSTDPIEVRICGDQLDEDVLLQQLELYVK